MLGLPAPYRTPGQRCLTDIELDKVEWSVMEQAKAKRALIGIYSSSASSASLYPLKCKGLFSTYKSVDRLTKEPTYYINIKSKLL
jgi:hypothetical protein